MTGVTLSGLLLLTVAGVPSDELDAHLRRAELDRKACGPRAAWHCLRRFGIERPYETVCRDVGLEAEGTTLAGLIEGLRKHGLPARAVVGRPERLADLPVPSLLVIDRSHCIVYEGFESGGRVVRYYEPTHQEYRTASVGAFLRDWAGQAIVFEEPQLSPLAFSVLVIAVAACTCLGGVVIAGVVTRLKAPKPPA